MIKEKPFGADGWRTLDAEAAVEKYANLVYRLAVANTGQKADAEDIFQEVFLRYVRKSPRFESEEHEKAWFIRVTVNCSHSFYTASFRKQTKPLEEAETLSEKPQDSVLEEYLLRLPMLYRTVLHLFYYERLSTGEIAKLLRKKESTVRMQLTRARRLLKEYMEGDGFHV